MENIYWDAGVFLAWLLPENDRVERCRATLDAAVAGEIKIVTSAICLTEVIHLKGQPKFDESSSGEIKNFFRNSYISVRNVDRRIAEAARELIWKEGIRPKDSIDLATALDAKLSLMHSFDDELVALSEKHGKPRLKISYPEVPR